MNTLLAFKHGVFCGGRTYKSVEDLLDAVRAKVQSGHGVTVLPRSELGSWCNRNPEHIDPVIARTLFEGVAS